MPTITEQPAHVDALLGVKQRRLWYHRIDLGAGLSTRFAEDYELAPALRRVDEACDQTQARLARQLGGSLTDASVLDLGCADGRFAFWAASQGATRVLGIERNRYNFDHARYIQRTFGFDQVQIRLDAVEKPIAEPPFDYVFCLSLIYHLVEPLRTLQRLRDLCTKQLFVVSALDLAELDGQPIARLDRYATGGHGMWSFNAAMVRQMLSTAGFLIDEEFLEDNPAGGSDYFAAASPGPCSQHHVFDETIDQEFPINVERRRRSIRRAWTYLAQRADKPIVIFGAGAHTPWMLEQVADLPGPAIAFVCDDRVPPVPPVPGLTVKPPTQIDPEACSAIVLSSWHQTDTLRRRAQALFGDRVRLIGFDESSEAP
ncbi:MAG: class I SAM-dependent methyltransferase [Phycisphaerae bacterium]